MENGLTDQLLAVNDKELEQKAIDIIILLLAEGDNHSIYGRCHVDNLVSTELVAMHIITEWLMKFTSYLLSNTHS